MLYEQPHQPLRVEDEFVPAGLLVPEGQGRLAERAPQAVCMWGGAPRLTGGPSPDDGVHAPYLRRALEDTQRPGKGVALVS